MIIVGAVKANDLAVVYARCTTDIPVDDAIGIPGAEQRRGVVETLIALVSLDDEALGRRRLWRALTRCNKTGPGKQREGAEPGGEGGQVSDLQTHVTFVSARAPTPKFCVPRQRRTS